RRRRSSVGARVQTGSRGGAPRRRGPSPAGVAAWGVGLMGVFPRRDGVPLQRVEVTIAATLDRSRPVRADVTVLNSFVMDLRLHGPSAAQGEKLVADFKKT